MRTPPKGYQHAEGNLCRAIDQLKANLASIQRAQAHESDPKSSAYLDELEERYTMAISWLVE